MSEELGLGGGLISLPPTDKIELGTNNEFTLIYMDFYVTHPQETSATAVRHSLTLAQAGQLLGQLRAMQRQLGFPSPEVSGGPQTRQ